MVRTLVVLVSLAALAPIGQAELVETTFEGRLSVISTQADLAARFAVGDLMRVTITYEWPGVDSEPADPYSAVYYGSIRSLSVAVDSTVPYSASATIGHWTVRNDFPPIFRLCTIRCSRTSTRICSAAVVT